MKNVSRQIYDKNELKTVSDRFKSTLPILFIPLVICFCLSASFTIQASEEIILTLNRTTKPPLSNPEQNGFVDQIASKALAAAGLKMKTLVMPAERALLDANSGKLDGELARVAGIEKTYTNLIPVAEKLMNVEFVAFSIKHTEIKHGWKDFEGASIAFLNGWKILEMNVPKSAYVTKVKNPRQLFDLLNLNRVDYVLYEKWAGLALARSLKIENINVLDPPLATRPLQMYLHKKHKEHIDIISQALKQLKTTGEYKKIYNETLEKFIKHE